VNFLAHCALAQDAADTWHCTEQERAGLIAGGVLGDFVKGPIQQNWPVELRAGVQLHRKVDALSNRDPYVRACSNRFPAELRRLAPIFVDLLTDYHLTRHWQQFYSQPLRQFSAQCYVDLANYQQYLTGPGLQFLQYMQDTDLLSSYHQWPTVQKGVKSVLRRLQRPELMPQVDAACRSLPPEAETEMLALYANLQTAWQQWNAFSVISAQQNS